MKDLRDDIDGHNKSSLDAEWPDEPANNSIYGIEGEELDSFSQTFEVPSAQHVAVAGATMPCFAQQYIDRHGKVHPDVVSLMTMLSNCLASQKLEKLFCDITPMQGLDELVYHIYGGGIGEAVVHFCEFDDWGIEGRQVVGMFGELIREKFHNDSFIVKLRESNV